MGNPKKGIKSTNTPELTQSNQPVRNPASNLTYAESLIAGRARGLCTKKASEQVLGNRKLRPSYDLIHFARRIAGSYSDCIELAIEEFGSSLADRELAKYGRINKPKRSKILEKCSWLASGLADWNNSRWYLAESIGVFLWEKDAIDSSTRRAFLYELNVYKENWSGSLEKKIDLRIDTTPLVPSSHPRKKSNFKSKVARMKEDQPGLPIRSILIRIDKMNAGNPNSVPWPWKGTPHRLLVDLDDDPKYHNRVKTYISKIKPSKS